jgi:hypothetical protein
MIQCACPFGEGVTTICLESGSAGIVAGSPNIERWLLLSKHRRMCMKLVERGVSVDRLRELFEYREGMLFRKVNVRGKRYPAGSRAGYLKSNGYRVVRVDTVLFGEHRLVFTLTTGGWPLDDIDHIDGNGSNNRIENLRDVTRQVNRKNTRQLDSNTSGICGVGWHKAESKWRADIVVNFKSKHLGFFTHIEDAIAARKAAETKFGFHPNHGRKLIDNSRAY